MDHVTIRTGCSYWPRSGGPFFLAGGLPNWYGRAPDRGEIRDDLSHMVDVGFQYARVVLPWEAAQPDARRARTPVLDRLAALLDAAEEAGITVQLALAGQFGGTLFLPQWLLATTPDVPRLATTMRVISSGWATPWPPANLYSDDTLLDSQQYLFHELAVNFGEHPALEKLDLGAGGLLSAIPPQGEDDAFRWWEALLESVHASSSLPVLYSDGAALLWQTNLPALSAWQEATGVLAIAATPAGSELARSGIDDTWPSFLMALAATLAHEAVGCAAIGVPTRADEVIAPARQGQETDAGELLLYSEEEQARFFHSVLPALPANGVPLVCHAVWADAPPTLYRTPPYDTNLALRHSGLLRADGSEKEAATVWRAFHQRDESDRRIAESPRTLELDEEEWYRRRGEEVYVKMLYERYLKEEI